MIYDPEWEATRTPANTSRGGAIVHEYAEEILRLANVYGVSRIPHPTRWQKFGMWIRRLWPRLMWRLKRHKWRSWSYSCRGTYVNVKPTGFHEESARDHG